MRRRGQGSRNLLYRTVRKFRLFSRIISLALWERCQAPPDGEVTVGAINDRPSLAFPIGVAKRPEGVRKQHGALFSPKVTKPQREGDHLRNKWWMRLLYRNNHALTKQKTGRFAKNVLFCNVIFTFWFYFASSTVFNISFFIEYLYTK